LLSSSYAHLLYLLPFPTRRSSDLEKPVRLVTNNINQTIKSVEYCASSLEQLNDNYSYGSTVVDNALLHEVLDNLVKQHECALETDRKSTRLNSSHVKISYAVFCLK